MESSSQFPDVSCCHFVVCVKVTIPCDANGDEKVNVFDLFDLGKAYDSRPLIPNWNPNCDFNENNNVANSDLNDLSNNYGKTDP